MPVTFADPADYDALNQDAVLEFSDIRQAMASGQMTVTDRSNGKSFIVNCDLTQRQQQILLAGGLLNYTKEGGQ